MSSGTVVAVGWHDTYFRWDISTPQRIVSRLQQLPGQGSVSVGRKLYAERDRFGTWQHVLGPQNVLVSWAVDTPKHGLIRRLEVQAHLGDSGKDDLCAPSSFDRRWHRLQTFMATVGVMPPDDPVCVRVDTAVDVVYGDTSEARRVPEGLRYARWPGQWYAEYQGPPPYTTVAIKKGRHTVGRVYCRNVKLRNGGPRWGKLRFESEHRFSWQQARPLDELRTENAASVFWGSVFGQGLPAGKVTRIEREVQTVKLIERVQLGEITAAQFEQLTGFLDAERLGLTDRVYKPETARRRRALARDLGVSPGDAEVGALAVNLDELLEVRRRSPGCDRGAADALTEWSPRHRYPRPDHASLRCRATLHGASPPRDARVPAWRPRRGSGSDRRVREVSNHARSFPVPGLAYRTSESRPRPRTRPRARRSRALRPS